MNVTVALKPSQTFREVSISQRRKARLRSAKGLALDHTARPGFTLENF